MAISLSTPVTGTAQTGLTSPTYTVTVDGSPPLVTMKQWAVTALGGTQSGVTAHSIASPFTISFNRPSNYKVLGLVNPTTGQLRSVPRNEFTVITRKGVLPLAGQAAVPAMVKTTIVVPAGSDLADPNSIRAMLSAHIGAVSQVSAGLGDTCVQGLL